MELIYTFYGFIFGCLLIVVQSPGTTFAAWFNFGDPKNNLVRDYDLINEYLVQQVQTNSYEENLIESVLWLKQYNEKKLIQYSGVAMSKFLPSLLQFTSLAKLLNTDPHCDLLGYDIIKNNELASGSNIMLPDELTGPLRRIELVIRQVAVYHANQCRYEYPKLFKWARQESNKERILQHIKVLMDAVISTSNRRVFTFSNVKEDERSVLKERAKGLTSMTGLQTVNAILFFVKSRAQEDPNGYYLQRVGDPIRRNRWIVSEAKVKELLHKYAFSQCEILIRSLGHILKPALYEQQLYENDAQYRALDEDNAELMIWLQYYRLCNRMVNEDREVLVKKIINMIWNE